MRTTPRIGTKPWFGPKLMLGWGWSPISAEGWVATGATIGVVVVMAVAVDNVPVMLTVDALAVIALIALCMLKGTSPGGPREAQELRRKGDNSP
jgi:hypothetical protein